MIVGYSSNEPLSVPSPTDDRALAAFRDLVRACLPQLALLGLWDYRIDSIASSVPIGTASATTPISCATLGGIPHDLKDGEFVAVAGVTGNTNANGSFFAHVTSPSAFDLYREWSGGSGSNPVESNGFYVGSAATVTRLNPVASCSPVDPSLGLPGAIQVRLTPSIAGERVVPVVGSRIVIAFLDGNAGKPVAVLGDPDEAASTVSICDGSLGAARVDDAVGCGAISATAPSGGGPVSFTYTPQGSNTPTVARSINISGVITAGSSRVRIG